MTDVVMGKFSVGTEISSKDSFDVAKAMYKQFQPTVSNPISREEAVRGIDFRRQKAFETNNTTMYDTLGHLLTMIKTGGANTAPKVTTQETKITGQHFDTNNIFAVG